MTWRAATSRAESTGARSAGPAAGEDATGGMLCANAGVVRSIVAMAKSDALIIAVSPTEPRARSCRLPFDRPLRPQILVDMRRDIAPVAHRPHHQACAADDVAGGEHAVQASHQ